MYEVYITLGKIFSEIINISITASWLVLAIIALKLLFKKAPKSAIVILWAFVGIRLILPFSFESVLSLIPSTNTIPTESIYNPDTAISENPNYPKINSGISFLNSAVNTSISDVAPLSLRNNLSLLGIIWIVGITALLLYAVISYSKIHRRVKESVCLNDNIYICDRIDTPFILGIIHPKIYIPSAMEQKDTEFVIAHEKAHLKRLDYLWKPLGFILLSVYWFNPIIWLAYILLCRDIELACDERVIKELGNDIKKPYSEALINCSVPQRYITACPLAFGEVGVKERIKSVLSYKKPALWIIIVSVITCIAVAVCFLTDPKNENGWQSDNYGISCNLISAECDDVVYEYIYGTLNDEYPYINVKWKNNTENTLCYGDEFTLYKDGELYTPEGEVGFDAILHTVLPKGEIEEFYHFAGYGLTNGSYRLEKEFYFENNPKEKYLAYINFTIDRHYSFVGMSYKGERIIFEDGSYSSVFYTDENIPQFVISDIDFHLLTSDHPKPSLSSTYYDLGSLQKISLTKKNFDNLFHSELWQKGYSAKYLRKNNLNAFSAFDTSGRKYYLLEQKNGDIYIAQGYSKVNHFRWVFKMKRQTNNVSLEGDGYITYLYAESPDPWGATLRLNFETNAFQFTPSHLSSYCGIGKFSVKADKSLLCKTSDGLYTYVFEAHEKGYTFNATKSSKLAEYKYSADSEPRTPVPDDSLFKRYDNDSASDRNQNPYFNATVSEVYKSSVLVIPFEDENVRKTADKISVSTKVISTNPVPKLKKGDEIRVVYNGSITESYPAQISGVFAIYLLSDISPEHNSTPTTLINYGSALIEANNKAETDKLYYGCLNTDKMSISSIKHLPIFRLSSKQELEGFKKSYSENVSDDNKTTTLPSFKEATARYDTDFFNHYSLLVIYISSPDSTTHYGAGDIYLNDNSLCVNVKASANENDIGKTPKGYFLTATVLKKDIKSCIGFDAVLDNEVYSTETN